MRAERKREIEGVEIKDNSIIICICTFALQTEASRFYISM